MISRRLSSSSSTNAVRGAPSESIGTARDPGFNRKLRETRQNSNMGHTPPAGHPPAALHGLLGIVGALMTTAAVSIAVLLAANLRLRRQRLELESRASQASEAAAMISHDLAQPLASAASLAELLAVD